MQSETPFKPTLDCPSIFEVVHQVIQSLAALTRLDTVPEYFAVVELEQSIVVVVELCRISTYQVDQVECIIYTFVLVHTLSCLSYIH